MSAPEILLKNNRLDVKILSPGEEYTRSRYDWGGIIRQVTLDGKQTFLSRELSGGGNGLGGIGLCSVWEWCDDALYNETSIADYFPLLGVGLLKKTDTSPFLFTRDYPVLPFERMVEQRDDTLCIRTLPMLCQGIAADQTRRIQLHGNQIIIENTLCNVGARPIHATEFCHNFFRFGSLDVDSFYELNFPYPIQPKLRRGELLLSRSGYRLGAFDSATASTAFSLEGFAGLSRHWMRLSHRNCTARVLIEDSFEVCRFYSWNNSAAFCPETFCHIDLAPGQSFSYQRKYTFEVD